MFNPLLILLHEEKVKKSYDHIKKNGVSNFKKRNEILSF